MDEKRLIEVDFPIREVSDASVREKNVLQGSISGLHIWWARRPLAASRATIYAALTPAPKTKEELKTKLELITQLSWNDKYAVEEAKKQILEFYGRRPRVLDCFAGGGSIPLEALRLGCETHALDYNPVAVLILKGVLEYPQKYGRLKVKAQKADQKTLDGDAYGEDVPKLVYDVEKWGNWVLEEAKREVGVFYPQDPDGSMPISYIWARTVTCQNPTCRAEIPLIRQLWLVNKEKRKIALKMIVDKTNKRVGFKVVQREEIDFDPTYGTTRKATVRCPICGSGMSDKELKQQFLTSNNEKVEQPKKTKAGQRMLAVVLYDPRVKVKKYRAATEKDLEIFLEAEKYLEKKRQDLLQKWGFDPVPDEPTPSGKGSGAERGIWIQNYGLLKWGDLFNSRQKLVLISLTEKIKLAYEKMIKQGYENEYAKAVTLYLAFILDRVADYTTTLCRWHNRWEVTANTFARQALPFVWDYSELNPFSPVSTGTWSSMKRQILRALVASIVYSDSIGSVEQGTAIKLPYTDGWFDAVITDPPYYDNVPYSDLSDFFYVWLKRIIGDIYPELFATPLTPKSQEIVVNATRHGGIEKAKSFFENMLTEAFKEIHRVLSPNGVAVIVFAYKSTEAWEAVINSLLRSGLVLTASWPIHTEMKERLNARETASLASSIYMICRKREKFERGDYSTVKNEIARRVKEKLTQFWEQGILGADFFVSAIGPAVEVFGKYSRVEKPSGEEVSVQELLEYVRSVVSEFALERVLKKVDLGSIDAVTRFYLLWRWTFNSASVPFDDAIKLSRSMGVELTELWGNGGVVKKEKGFVRVLAPHERGKDPAFPSTSKLDSMIDVLHYTLVLWERGEREKIKQVLNDYGYVGKEVFWQVAQTISDVLPEGDKEKQLLQAFLYSRDSYFRRGGLDNWLGG